MIGLHRYSFCLHYSCYDEVRISGVCNLQKLCCHLLITKVAFIVVQESATCKWCLEFAKQNGIDRVWGFRVYITQVYYITMTLLLDTKPEP